MFSPREPAEYDTEYVTRILTNCTFLIVDSESRPLLSRFLPHRMRVHCGWRQCANLQALGGQEFLLPDGARYFSNPTLYVVTDVDLCNTERLDVITTFLDERDQRFCTLEWELWLHEVSEPATASFLVKAWVHQVARMVLFERPSLDPGEIINKVVNSELLRAHVR